MKTWTSVLPNFIKRVLSPVRRWLESSGLYFLATSRENAVRRYWRNPWDEPNRPVRYLDWKERSDLLVALVREFIPSETATILEIGCNAGRNLNALFSAGYRALAGVEINSEAVRLLRETFPEMAQHATIHTASVEQIIRTLPDDAFDVVFTMAVLEHLPPASDWVFREVSRIARSFVITVEDEHGKSWRHFPRKYREVFEELGLVQMKEIDCAIVVGFGPGFFARVFQKASPFRGQSPKPT